MQTHHPFSPALPQKKPGHLIWNQSFGATTGLALANLAKTHHNLILIITPNMLEAYQLEKELLFFKDHTDTSPLFIFPDWETLAYDMFSPHQDIVSQRIETLSALPRASQGILIVPITTLMQRLAPRKYLATHSLSLSTGEKIDLPSFRLELGKSGYHSVSQVTTHGEFAIRGSIIDLYPMGSDTPYRIDLFDDDIESIRSFDIDSQRSIEKLDFIRLLPAHEFPLTEDAIDLFRQQWGKQFSGNPMNAPLYQNITEGYYTAGIEYYLPLFFEKTASLFDYLPDNTLIIRLEKISDYAQRFWKDTKERYEQLRHDILRPILSPPSLFLSEEELFSEMKPFSQINIRTSSGDKTGHYSFTCEPPPSFHFTPSAKQPLAELDTFLRETTARILFCSETLGRRESLLNLLKTIQIQPTIMESWHDFLNHIDKIGITVAPLDEGLYCTDPHIVLISESQLFGQRVLQRRRRDAKQHDTHEAIRNLAELHIGDPVVHIDHGVGRYLGLQALNIKGNIDEYLTLEYANKAKLYVPVSSLHLISRYSSTHVENAPLHKLGSEKWDKVKQKALKRIRDVAAELLDIYSKRAARPGYPFLPPDPNYCSFSESFPFEETPDQDKAIESVIQDMIKPKAMDRLVCGDVGFGKTEVAMRAAFLAIQNNKQTAILVPTTLLAQQHYQTFINRFANWPVTIAILSRFQTPKQQKETLEALQAGKIDIIIGTHKLIQNNIKFYDLGLLIIDEEHRFGVRQKERLKALRSEVDILTLTATPIPRTLNMTLSGLRDLSIIATPPERRLSIKTFIHTFDKQIIREAIKREMIRGGQVYFLHNEVNTIQRAAEDLSKLIPEARIGIAHGQMRGRELEHTMAEFYHRRFHILMCSTIIENGIDIPSANTIIIHRADKFGLAQLHQLRGRVGRSHHQAYAYLLIPPKGAITKDAKKRLEAIASLEELGIGFTLASHDLEIRGAGELLGEEQSGHMQEIGFTLYMELLERAVHALKSGKQPHIEEPIDAPIEIDLSVSTIIPENYLPDTHQRLILYKRIANATSQPQLDDLRVEMIDRFGLLPEKTKHLFKVSELKQKACLLGIKKITAHSQSGYIEFNEHPNINPNTILKLVQTHSQIYQFAGPTRLKIKIEEENPEKRIQQVENILQALSE